MSCDEAVLRQLNGQQKKGYATTLLSFADRTVSGGSLAFGEPYAKKRIRNVLQYRRPAYRWMLVLTVMCVALAGCLLTDPVKSESLTSEESWEQESREDITESQSEKTTEPEITLSESQQEEGEKETTEDDLYFAQLDSYEKSFRIGSKSPQITDKSTSWYADLDHDGEDERLVFDWGYMEPGSFGIFAVLNTQGEVVYVDTPASAHVGWVNYYLCQWKGRDYLLEYQPGIGTGMGEYSYALLELNGDDHSLAADQNSLWNVVDQQFVSFHVGPGDYIKEFDKDWEMDISAMVDLAYMLNLYMEKSYLLVSTDEGWLREAIHDSGNGMFVLGSPEEPHRQYENYSIFTSEERPTQKSPSMDDVREILENWCEKEGIPQVDQNAKYEARLQGYRDYIASYQVGGASPQITAESVTWEADLTHDGQPEQVIFDWSQFDACGEGMFAVLDTQGKVLYSDEVTSSHSWLRTYYLCSWKGKEYLFRYDPYMMQEEGSYWYELFYLTEDGEKIIEDTERIGFSIAILPSAPNNGGKRVMDIPAMVAFADQVNEYIQNSFLLVSSDWDWISELEIVPRKYFVIGSPQKPYRLQETYDWFNKTEDLLGLDLSTLTDVREKIKTWCKAAKIPYIE